MHTTTTVFDRSVEHLTDTPIFNALTVAATPIYHAMTTADTSTSRPSGPPQPPHHPAGQPREAMADHPCGRGVPARTQARRPEATALPAALRGARRGGDGVPASDRQAPPRVLRAPRRHLRAHSVLIDRICAGQGVAVRSKSENL